MYRLLIVDDDEVIRAGIEKSIHWEENEFEVCATAKNGVEGLEMARLYQPHIVISDIKMPFMDGLQMAKCIHDEFPLIKILILTDYDNFEYARQAIDLKVLSYLLKYSENEEILHAVIKAKEELVKETAAKEQEIRGKPSLQEKFFRELIAGVAKESEAEKETGLLDIKFKGDWFGLAVLKIENYQALSTYGKAVSLESAIISVSTICKEISEEYGTMPFTGSNQGVNILFSFSGPEVIGTIANIVERIKERVEESLNVNVVIGVGNVYEGLKGIPISYNEAVLAVEMKDLMKAGSIVYMSNIKESESSHNLLINQIVDYVDHNYFKESLTLNDIAQIVHISPTYISTIFKKYKNINFSDYLIRIRMEKAKELLVNTDLKAYEVCERIGYSDHHYFSILFKKYTGYTITEFKEINKTLNITNQNLK